MRKMGKKIMVFMLCLIVFSVIGCDKLKSMVPGRKTDASSIPVRTDYRTGKKGLELDTLKNAPPSEVMEEDDFQIGIKVQNKGAYKLTEGKLALHRLKPKLILAEGEQLTNIEIKDPYEAELEGKNRFNPEGTFYNKFFKVKAGEIATEKRYDDAQFTVIGCYKYKTEASVDICINPHLYETETVVEKVVIVREFRLLFFLFL